ncbi:MAG: hypothetical protein KF689_08080 [Gemmatimonadaceae bacterium]|nr:hypothetical protein [Gemmatimonadaceae bacterium]MCW5827442.1 hypothetical protein [Gemmatimonadaceae bacterium]
MKKLVFGLVGAVMLTAVAVEPLLANETVAECQDRVIMDCDAALKESNWLEKVAVGIVCTGRLIACGGVTLQI